MEASERLNVVREFHSEARRRKLLFQTCDDTAAGHRITLNGRSVLAFSSCSYLALEHHPALVRGVHDAVDRYGTQFSSSRGYLSAPPYLELEERLSAIFGGHALVVPTTTLGHQCVLPVLVDERDALVLDHQVHQSVRVGATLARANGVRVEVVRHGEPERACELVAQLARRVRTVWFACDGVYSMYGDLAPVRWLRELLDIAPNVRLYVDDAHGMSWTGQHGRGSFLSRMPLTPRIVLLTSFAKAFAAGGGCAVFADPDEREVVRMCGGPMLFSGPMQPPMLGAALASARVHLSDEIVEHQDALRKRVDLCNRLLKDSNLHPLVENEAPIFFLPLGLPRAALAVAERLLERGIYVNVSTFPSVPMDRAGIRLAITNAHSFEDIERVVDELASHVPSALAAEGMSRRGLDELFEHATPKTSRQALPTSQNTSPSEPDAELRVECYRTIERIDRALWDSTMGSVGACSWDAMYTAEKLFANKRSPEHDWGFYYLLVRDKQSGRPVCVTFFVRALLKDDMLMREEVSEVVEMRRTAEPYYLTSVALMAGSPMSEGNHVYLDRRGPWRAALARVLQIGYSEYEASDANVFMLRDMPGDDREMDSFMQEQGFVKVPMLDSHRLEIRWTDEELAGTLSKRKRKHLREQGERARLFDVRIHGVGRDTHHPPTSLERSHLHRLYSNVARRNRRLNTFELPLDLIDALLNSPAWEIVTLRLPVAAGGPSDGLPVAWYAAHVHDGHYAPFLCGLDYRYVLSQGVYRQLLYQIVVRAQAQGYLTVHFGMDADTEKARFGTRLVKNCIYTHVRDDYNDAVLRELVEELGVNKLALSA